jgi:hypothetical protein
MGLFGRDKRRSGASGLRLPPDFARKLEQYGRWTFDPQGSGVATPELGDYELYTLAQPDPDAFIGAVANIALPAGGWAVYAGARAVWNAVGPDVRHQDYLAMLDAAIDFVVRQHGMDRLAPFEFRRLQQTRPPAGQS